MIPFKIIGRKKLPDLNQKIDLKDIDEPTDEEVLEQLRKELNELKKERNTIPAETKKEEGIKEIQDFNSLSDIKDYLENIDEDFFNENIETIKEKIIDFYDLVLPEREIGFEISLLNDKELILEKVNYSLEIYGDLSLNEKKEVEIKEDNDKENTKQKEEKNIETQEEIKKETENKEKIKDYFLNQDEAIKILSPVTEKKGFKINNKIITSLEDLNKYIRSLPLVDFDLNILALSKRKNLCEWIEHTIGYKKLAEKLELAEDKEEILEIIDEMIKYAKDAQNVKTLKTETEEKQSTTQKHSYQTEPQIGINKEDHFEKNNYEVNNKEEKINKKNKFDILNFFSSNNNKETSEKSKKESLKQKDNEKGSKIENQESNVKTQGISKILNDLMNYSNERFKDEKQTILKELSNHVSDSEIRVFQNAKTKDEFQELLEQYLYSYPFFEERLKGFEQKEKEGKYKEQSFEKEENEEKLIKNDNDNKLELHSYRDELKKDFSIDNSERIHKDLDYSKTKSNKLEEQKLELPNEKNISKEGNIKTSNLEKDLSTVDNQYNFFDERNQLKEEIEQIKYESLIDLPPPDYSLDDELSNLIKPEILDSTKYLRTQKTDFSQKEKPKQIITNNQKLKHNEEIQNKSYLEQEKHKINSESIRKKLLEEKELTDKTFNPNKNLKSIEEQILEKELELLNLKNEMLRQKKQQEKQILKLLQTALSSQREVLTQMNENQKIREEIIDTVTNPDLNIENLQKRIEGMDQKVTSRSEKEKDQKQNKSDNKIKSLGESMDHIENKERLQGKSKNTDENKDLITEFAFNKETPTERLIRSNAISINEEKEQNVSYSLNFKNPEKNEEFTILEEIIPIKKGRFLLFQKHNTKISIKNKILLDDEKKQTSEKNKERLKSEESKDNRVEKEQQENEIKTEKLKQKIKEEKQKEGINLGNKIEEKSLNSTRFIYLPYTTRVENQRDKIKIILEQKEPVVSYKITKPQERLKQLNKELEKRREIIKKTKEISEKYKQKIESESVSIDEVLNIIEEFLGDGSSDSSLNEVSNLITEAKSLIKKKSKKQANDALRKIQDLKEQANAEKIKNKKVEKEQQENEIKTEKLKQKIKEEKQKEQNKKTSRKAIKSKTKKYQKREEGLSEILTEVDKSLSMNDLDSALELIENAKNVINNK